jgi:hypothetical protein
LTIHFLAVGLIAHVGAAVERRLGPDSRRNVLRRACPVCGLLMPAAMRSQ